MNGGVVRGLPRISCAHLQTETRYNPALWLNDPISYGLILTEFLSFKCLWVIMFVAFLKIDFTKIIESKI